MARQIFTLGYQGLTPELFIASLKSAEVTMVIDVRANPVSRKRGFSKKALASKLNDDDIAYAHVLAFGCPKSTRDRYKDDSDWAAYTRGYLAHLRKEGEALAQLAKTANELSCCLVCYETDFERCHRTFVAQAAAKLAGLSIIHLIARTAIADVQARAAA